MIKKERGAPAKSLTLKLRAMKINDEITIEDSRTNAISPYCAYVRRRDGYKFKTSQRNENSVVRRIS